MAELKQAELSRIIRAEEAKINDANKSIAFYTDAKEIEIAKGALDAAGIADPSPTSDGMSCALSMATGDYWGALWSTVSMAPYFGDAIGKPAKAIKAYWKAEELAEILTKATAKLAKAQKALTEAPIKASEKAAEVIRTKLLKAKTGNCRYGTKIPARGKWTPPDDPGNGIWTSPNGHVVPYKDGYPEFDKAYIMQDGQKIPAVHPDGSVKITDMVGKNEVDFRSARDAMREKLGDPKWKQPSGYTWHHGEDGTSMTLVDSSFHHGTNGANHTGGASIAREPEF